MNQELIFLLFQTRESRKLTRRGGGVNLCVLFDSARKFTWYFLLPKGKCIECEGGERVGGPRGRLGLSSQGYGVLTPLVG